MYHIILIICPNFNVNQNQTQNTYLEIESLFVLSKFIRHFVAQIIKNESKYLIIFVSVHYRNLVFNFTYVYCRIAGCILFIKLGWQNGKYEWNT
mgnify:CR=1 FL=1